MSEHRDKPSQRGKPSDKHDSGMWSVYIHNDRTHSFTHAVSVIITATGMTADSAVRAATKAHLSGEARIADTLTRRSAIDIWRVLQDSGFGSDIREELALD